MKKHFWWYFFALTLFSIIVLIVAVCGLLFGRVYRNAFLWKSTFSTHAGRELTSIIPELMGGFLSTQKASPPVMRYLILGKDEVAGSQRPTVLTDTIIVATYRPDLGKVRLLSLPRDIYIPEQGVKVNMLYRQGLEERPAQPESVPQRVISSLLGVKFDGTVALSLEELRELIDLLGGIQVTVQHSFTDERFPRSGVDVTKERDPKKLYETVSFVEGTQIMTGETALKYIRSRKSSTLSEANDDARARRQQQVIEALLVKLQDPKLIAQPKKVGQLYSWYARSIQHSLSLTELGRGAGAVVYSGKKPELEKIVLPVTEYARATDSAMLFVHPPDSKYGQWVYEAVDPSWKQLQEFVQEKGL